VAVPPLVVFVGDLGDRFREITDMVRSGAVVLLAPDRDAVRAWVADPPAEAWDEHRALVTADGLELDLSAHSARWQGRPLDLTERELRLLAALAFDPGRAITFDQLVRSVWDRERAPEKAVIHSAVKRLRRKLHEDRVGVDVHSVRGVGFRLEATPRPTAVSAIAG
jgi:DNA-binding response OmpR family regulator